MEDRPLANRTRHVDTLLCSCDLDLDPNLAYILKVYLHIKNEVSRSRLSKVRAQTDRHADSRNRIHYHAAFAGGDEYSKKLTRLELKIGRLRDNILTLEVRNRILMALSHDRKRHMDSVMCTVCNIPPKCKQTWRLGRQ